MATLEKIRSKSVLLFTIIIVALLAFILGDFLTSGRTYFGPGDTVASANGVKVKFNDYQERVSQLSDQQKNSGRQVDSDILSEQAIEALLTEGLLNQEYDRLGITVTDKEISDIMLGDSAPQVFQSLMGQFGQGAQVLMSKGIIDARAFYNAMNTPAKYGLQPEDGQFMKQAWISLENNLTNSIRSQAFGLLMQGLFTANQVDAKALYNDRNTTRHFAYVRKDLSSIADDKVKLTDEDYQKVYDEHKGAFRINEENRAVSYIVVPIIPSDADYAAGAKNVENVIAALSAAEGTGALSQYPDFVAENGKYTHKTLAQNPQLRSLTTDSTTALSAGAVRTTMAVGGNYVLAKVNNVTTGIDRVKFSAFGEMATAMDSIKARLNVADFDSIARANGGQVGLTTSLVNPSVQLSEAQTNALAQQPVGQIFFLNDTISGTDKDGKPLSQIVSTAFLISERDAAVSVYDIAKINYTVVPSDATVKDLTTRFHAYVANNATAESFSKNAEKSGYTVGTAMVSASTPLVGNTPNSRGAVKWAMDNSKGKVSPVFNKQSGAADYLMAIAVDDIYSSDYIPVSATVVREALKGNAMAEKKAEMLIKQYAGKAKDINGYATVMGVQPAETDAIFANDQISGIGYAENNVQGVVAAAAQGKVSGPFKGNNAVYVITVLNAKTDGRPYNFDESATTFKQKFLAPMTSNPLQLLLGKAKVKNNILEFTPSDVN